MKTTLICLFRGYKNTRTTLTPTWRSAAAKLVLLAQALLFNGNAWGQTTVFDYTGIDQNFPVPAELWPGNGISCVRVHMWGAGGGGTNEGSTTTGGGGAYVTGILAVTPSENLTIMVGQGGAYNNNTDGTNYGGGRASGGDLSGWGGGRSAICRGTPSTLSNNIVVAGGGGGAGRAATGGGNAGSGGAGGLTNGAQGGTNSSKIGGDGGSQTAGGAGGTGDTNGSNGGALSGGRGGTGIRRGGGGGGGYYGGGGGGSDNCGSGCNTTDHGAGGGGGSSRTDQLSNSSASAGGSGATEGCSSCQTAYNNNGQFGRGGGNTTGGKNGRVVIELPITTNKGTITSANTEASPIVLCPGGTVASTGGGSPAVNFGTVTYEWYCGAKGADPANPTLYGGWQNLGNTPNLPAYDPQNTTNGIPGYTEYMIIRRVFSSCGARCYPNCESQDNNIYVVVRPAIPAPTVSNNGPFCAGNTASVTAAGLAVRGKTASFNGSNSTMADVSYNTTTNNFTVEFWAKPAATRTSTAESNTGTAATAGGQRYVIRPFQQGGGTASSVGVSVGTNGVSIVEHDAGHAPIPLVWDGTLTGWNHIALVYRSKTPYLYINGVLVRQGLTTTKTNIFPLIGSNLLWATEYYNGEVDNIRVFNVAKTSQQINQDMHRETPLTSGLIAHYTFNSSNGNASTGTNSSLSNATFSDQSFYTYTWNPTATPSASTSETQTTGTLNTTTDYSVVASVAGQCNSLASSATTVTINAIPVISGTLSVCSGLTTALSATETPHPTTPWTSSNTTVATVNSSGVVTGGNEGTATITYTTSGGCTTTATVSVTALTAPTITNITNP